MTPRRDPASRDGSLDAMRGLTVLLMAIVNLQGSADHAWRQLAHAPWHGLTLADLVFPWFLLIVGLSIPLAMVGGSPPLAKLWRRSALLIVLGIVLAWLIRPTLDPAGIRWPGVLQRIGIVYLACALVARAGGGWRTPLLMAVALLALHGWLLHLPPPGGDASLARGLGLAGWLDRALLPGRLYPPGFDPEGVLSTLGAIANGLIGLGIMRLARARPGQASAIVLIAGLLLTLAGLGVAAAIPLNKSLWTPSFVLVTAGSGLLAWSALRAAWPALGTSPPARGLVFYGRTALSFYVVHMLLMAVLVRHLPAGERLWDAGYHTLATTGLAPPLAALTFAILAAAAATGITALLARRGWLIRV